jgi:acyl-CoA synthetase (AMP-forming)/AMP-acid ligase II
MRYFSGDSQPNCAITEPQFAEMIAACAPQLKWQAVRDEDSWTGLAGDPGEFRPRAPDPMAPMSLQYTSGTTSRPKGDGYLSFADRAKDMLKVGAEKVAASEIERVIMATGLVAEVAVVGRPDDKLDEVPVAFVVPLVHRESLAAEVEAACAQHLADFKLPRAV